MGTPNRTGQLLVAMTLTLAAGGLGDELQAQSRDTAARPARIQVSGPGAPLDTAMASQLSGAFRAAAERALPAVVQIRVTALRTGEPRGGRTPSPRGEPRSRSTGSGFIIDSTGHVVTNHHVVDGAERLSVVLSDGREFDAELIGSDPNTDVAVIRIQSHGGEPLPAAEFGDSDALRVGDWVLALGNPLGLQFTVTAGIVSAKGRSINILESPDNTQLEAFIQTDAAINPGNSGGPLVDLLGRVVGINSAIESRTGFFSGAGFAIPINLAAKVANDLIRYGVVHRPRLGVIIQDVTAADAEVYSLPEIAGAEIAAVTAGTPAEQAGLRMGDVVVAVNGEPIRTVTELQARVARFQPGETVRLQIVRYGTTLEREVQLGEFTPAMERRRPAPVTRSGMELLGFGVDTIPRAMAETLGLADSAAVAIIEVTPFGPAEEAFVPRNVALLRVNGEAVASKADVERIAARIRPGDVISIVTLNPRLPEPAPTIYNYRAR